MAYEEAQQFLARVVPWPTAIDPPEFFVNIHSPSKYLDENGVEKTAYGGRAARTLAEAIRFIGWKVDKADLYVCMSAQAQGKPKTNRFGGAYWNALRSAHNCVAHRCFYIDIDVKPGAYATTEEAMDAFVAFCNAVGLPPPTFVVASGSGGFHVHWVIDDPIPTSVWQQVANDLHGAILYHGLKADPQCTTNPVQILRVPGTFNFKHTPPKPVTLEHAGPIYSLSRIADVVLKYRQFNMAPRAAHAPPHAAAPALNFQISPLAAGLSTSLVPNRHEDKPGLLEIAKVCPFVRDAATRGGVDYLQPLWWETAKIAFHVREGRSALTIMAEKYPKYDASENDELYARIVRERTPVDKYGWPQCSTIRGAGSPVCDGCDWWKSGQAAGRSPFNFMAGSPAGAPAAPTPQVTAEVTPTETKPLQLPVNFFQDKEGKLWYQPPADKDGVLPKAVSVCPYPFRSPIVTYGDNPKIIFEIIADQRGWIPVEIERKLLGDNHAFQAAAGGQDLSLQDSEAKAMRSMLTTFVQQLRDRKERSIPSEPFGWSSTDGSPDAFCFNRTRYNCKGDTPSALADPKLQRMYEPSGRLEVWRKGMKLINDQHRPELDMIVAAGFGAPFMEFTSEKGVLISATSTDSGVQKSTAMRVATAIWGSPPTRRRVNDTENMVSNQIGFMKNLPVFWDEIRGFDMVKRTGELIFTLSQGQDKGRLQRTSKQQEIRTWATLLVAAGNNSLFSMAQEQSKNSPAGMYRVYEFMVPPRIGMNGFADDAPVIINACDYNYGWAGVEVAKYLGSNAGVTPERVDETRQMIMKAVGGSDKERYWIAGMACSLLGAQMANKLDLAAFDIEALYKFEVRTLDSLRRQVEGSGSDLSRVESLVEILSEFLLSHRGGIFVSQNFAAGRGRPGTTLSVPSRQLYYDEKVRMVAHVAELVNRLRVNKAALHAWLKKEERHPGDVFRGFRDRLGAVEARFTLAGGTRYAQTNAKGFEFDLSHPALVDLLPPP